MIFIQDDLASFTRIFDLSFYVEIFVAVSLQKLGEWQELSDRSYSTKNNICSARSCVKCEKKCFSREMFYLVVDRIQKFLLILVEFKSLGNKKVIQFNIMLAFLPNRQLKFYIKSTRKPLYSQIVTKP